MKLRFTRSFGSIFGTHHRNSEPMDIPDEYAKNWIEAGYAEAVEEELQKPKRTRSKAAASETSTETEE